MKSLIKKVLVLLTLGVLLANTVCMLSGCKKQTEPEKETEQVEQATEEETEEKATEEKEVEEQM